MELSIEEVNVLNKAVAILSKYANSGVVSKDLLDSLKKLTVPTADLVLGEESDNPYVEMENLPFGTLQLSYFIGYYDEARSGKFELTCQLINVNYGTNYLSFDTCERNTADKFRSLNDFTISPTVALTHTGKVYALCRFDDSQFDLYNIPDEDAERVVAPTCRLFPIVLECKVVEVKGDYPWHVIAKILKKRVLKSEIGESGELDYLGSFRTLKWLCMGDVKEDKPENEEG